MAIGDQVTDLPALVDQRTGEGVQARQWVTSAGEPVGLPDRLFNAAADDRRCRAVDDGSGVIRCVDVEAPYVPPDPSLLRYGDEACTQVVAAQSYCGVAPRYAVEYMQGGCGLDRPTVARIFELGAVHEASVYAVIDGVCTLESTGPFEFTTYFEVGEEVDPSVFPELTAG